MNFPLWLLLTLFGLVGVCIIGAKIEESKDANRQGSFYGRVSRCDLDSNKKSEAFTFRVVNEPDLLSFCIEERNNEWREIVRSSMLSGKSIQVDYTGRPFVKATVTDIKVIDKKEEK